MPAPYTLISVEGFAGPFDLLLELTRARKLDISKVSLRKVTDDFLAYINQQDLSPEVLGDYLVVAATLLLLKVRRLIPRFSEEEEAEVVDLTQRLRVYQLFRERAARLRERWGGHRLFAPAAFGPVFAPVQKKGAAAGEPARVSLRDLENAFRGIVGRLPKPLDVRAHVRPRGKSFQECLDLFLARLEQWKTFAFRQAIAGQRRDEQAVSFLAVLELARQRQVNLSQESVGGDLTIERIV